MFAPDNRGERWGVNPNSWTPTPPPSPGLLNPRPVTLDPDVFVRLKIIKSVVAPTVERLLSLIVPLLCRLSLRPLSLLLFLS